MPSRAHRGTQGDGAAEAAPDGPGRAGERRDQSGQQHVQRRGRCPAWSRRRARLPSAGTFRGRRGGGESHKYSTARGAGPLARMRRRGCRRDARRARTHTPPPRTAAISRNRPQTGSPAPTHCPTASPERSNIKHKHMSGGSDAC